MWTDKPTEGRRRGSLRIELRYLPGEDTTLTHAAGDLRGAAGESKMCRVAMVAMAVTRRYVR